MSGNGGGPVGTGAVRGLLSLYGTNSEYNKRKSSDNGLVDFASAKRVRSEYFPAGKFNDNGAGPTSVLADKGNDRESMVKNLATNQTEKTLYINIPRFIMPVLLSNGHTGTGNRNMALCKSVVAGDVVFHLRFNNHMIENNHATTVLSKSVIAAACFAVNLQTVNYILSHLHRQLAFFTDAMLGDDARSLGGNAWNHPYELDRTAFMAIIEARQRVLETDIDMKTWSIFFLNISRSSGSDAFSELFKRGAAASAQSFFGKWFAKMRQRQNDTGAVVAPSERKLMLEKYLSRLVWQFLRTYIKIAGIFIGTDYQGGNDQGDPNPCWFLSTDYTGTIQVAGKSLKVKNMWSSQAPGVVELCAVATALEDARSQPHRPAFLATVDVALERVQDITWLLLMCPMYCSDADMWWPVYEKVCLLLQLLESHREDTAAPAEDDLLLDVSNMLAKMCSSMMTARVVAPTTSGDEGATLASREA